MKTRKTTLIALLFLLALGLFAGSEVIISNAHAQEDDGIIIEDEGEMDSSSVTDQSVEDDSESYPASESDD